MSGGLVSRVRALARRFDAIAEGAHKRLMSGDRSVSVQDPTNARRDAATLHAAADVLEGATDYRGADAD